MATKRRERQLSKEELATKLRHERADLWIRSKPLFAAIKPQDGTPTLFPLDSKIERTTSIIFSGEATLHTALVAFQVFQHFLKRYIELAWLPIFCFPLRYQFLRSDRFYTLFQPHEEFLRIIVTLEPQNEFARIFDCVNEPTFLLFSGAKLLKKWNLDPSTIKNSVMEMEQIFQQDLLTKDMGLPIPRVRDLLQFDHVEVEQLPMNQGLSGPWGPNLGGAQPTSRGCQAKLHVSGTRALILADIPKDHNPSRIQVHWNNEIVPESIAGTSIKFGVGQSVMDIDAVTGIHEVLNGGGDLLEGELELSFPDPSEEPITYYGTQILKQA